eukprot:5497769-Pyramimonas_sp.AAC.1
MQGRRLLRSSLLRSRPPSIHPLVRAAKQSTRVVRMSNFTQSVSCLPRFRSQERPSHTTRLPVERPDQSRPQLGIA